MEQKHLRRARIAAEVRAELARQNKTRASLSQATGISVDTLRRRLDGVRPFYMDELDSITLFLGIPLVEFVARTESTEAA